MTRQFIKTIDCGCVVKAITCGVKNLHNGQMYMLGGYNHLIICDICKKKEDCNEDTLYNMWINDNITNDFGYLEWYLYEY